jgi:hypothetical protein
VSSGDATQVDGLPVTSLFRTTCDLTRRLPFPEAVMVADAALRSGLDRGELVQRVVGGRGWSHGRCCPRVRRRPIREPW